MEEIDQLGWTPLLHAASNGDSASVKTLLATGADPNVKAFREWTPLLAAAFAGSAPTIRLLLKAGANLTHVMADPDASLGPDWGSGWTAMTWAACGGHAEALGALREAGLSVEWRDAVRYVDALLRNLGGTPQVREAGREQQEVPDYGSGETPDSYYRIYPDIFEVAVPLPTDPMLEPVKSQVLRSGHQELSVGRNTTEKQGSFVVTFESVASMIPHPGRDAGMIRLWRFRDLASTFRLQRHLRGTDPIALPADAELLKFLAQQGLGWAVERLAPEGTTRDRLQPALWEAAHRGDGPLVRFLLKRGADPLDRRHDTTLLHSAAGAVDAGALIALIEAGASVKAIDYFEGTPLHRAAENGSAACIRELLARGANPRVKNRVGEKPFDSLSEDSDVEAVQLLLPVATRTSKAGAWRGFVRADNLPVLKALMEAGVRPDIKGVRSNDTLRVLLDKGADPDVVEDGKTKLHRAVRIADEVAIRLLLEKGAKVEALDGDGETPLILAARASAETSDELAGSPVEVAKLLLAHGAKVDAPNRDGWTALFVAALHKSQRAFIEILLEKGADPNRAAQDGNTPLHEAVAVGSVEIAHLFVVRGGRPDLPNKKGETALMLAGTKAALLQALAVEGSPVSIPPGVSDKALLEQGQDLLNAKLADRAEPYFQELLRRKPDHAEALNLLGVSRLRDNRFEEALALLERSIAADPEDFMARHNAGLAAEKLGRRADALRFQEEALQAIGDLPYGLRGIDRIMSAILDAKRRVQ